jgi:Rrf2 family protein
MTTANTQFALGVHTLTLLAGAAPQSLSSEEMAGSANANPVHVRRVLGRFRTAGLVASRPGVGGGSHLAQDPTTITLAHVWSIIHGDEQILGLRGANPRCAVGQSIQTLLTDIDRQARRALEDELATTTIADLVSRAVASANLHAVA